MHPNPLPLGTPLQGGLYAGILTNPNGEPYVLVLLPEQPADRLTWRDAMAWAEGLGDGADLPTRAESALLFALLQKEFKPNWHWTNTPYGASSAWFQTFSDGVQSLGRQHYEFCARAVRRLILQPFDPLALLLQPATAEA